MAVASGLTLLLGERFAAIAKVAAMLDRGFAVHAFALRIALLACREVGTECHPNEQADRPADEEHEK